MNKTLSTTLIVIAVVALAAGLFFLGTMYTGARSFGPAMMYGNGWNNNRAYEPGVNNAGQSGYGYGRGMMGNRAGGYGMMGGYQNPNTANTAPLTVEQAKAAAEKYVAGLNNTDLKLAEVMVFNNNAYVAVKEASTGRGAFELLVDPVTKVAYPEHGPNMMWNLKYGGLNHQSMMGSGYGMMRGRNGMMGNWNYQNTVPSNPSTDMTVTAEQAVKDAQAYLDQYQAGTTAAADPVQFYGYYTLDFSRNGNVAGMLSINGYSGQVFLHTWHGAFIEEATIQ